MESGLIVPDPARLVSHPLMLLRLVHSLRCPQESRPSQQTGQSILVNPGARPKSGHPFTMRTLFSMLQQSTTGCEFTQHPRGLQQAAKAAGNQRPVGCAHCDLRGTCSQSAGDTGLIFRRNQNKQRQVGRFRQPPEPCTCERDGRIAQISIQHEQLWPQGRHLELRLKQGRDCGDFESLLFQSTREQMLPGKIILDQKHPGGRVGASKRQKRVVGNSGDRILLQGPLPSPARAGARDKCLIKLWRTAQM